MSPTTEPTNNETSTKQTEANRENARHSTGPRRDESKRRTRLNGLRHGLTSKETVMPWEDRQAHDKFVDALIAEWAPAGAREAELAKTIAEDEWRIARIRNIETNIFALGLKTEELPFKTNDFKHNALAQAQTYVHNAKELNLLSIYDQRLARKIKLNTDMLRELQAARQAEEAKALEEATLLAFLAESKGETFSPEANGFGFSTEYLAKHRGRQRRLAEARKLLAARSKPAPSVFAFVPRQPLHRTA